MGSLALHAASASNPVGWGVTVAATAATASRCKAAYDYNTTMEDIVAGYVCKELEGLGRLQVSDDSIQLR